MSLLSFYSLQIPKAFSNPWWSSEFWKGSCVILTWCGRSSSDCLFLAFTYFSFNSFFWLHWRQEIIRDNFSRCPVVSVHINVYRWFEARGQLPRVSLCLGCGARTSCFVETFFCYHQYLLLRLEYDHHQLQCPPIFNFVTWAMIT